MYVPTFWIKQVRLYVCPLQARRGQNYNMVELGVHAVPTLGNRVGIFVTWEAMQNLVFLATILLVEKKEPQREEINKNNNKYYGTHSAPKNNNKITTNFVQFEL